MSTGVNAEEAGAACQMNIGPRERRKRRRMGIAGLAIGLLTAVALVALRVPRIWRLALVLPWTVGVSGLLQARAKT